MAQQIEVDAIELIKSTWDNTTIESYSKFGSFSPDASSVFEAYKFYYQRQWCLMTGYGGQHAALKTPSEINEFVRHIAGSESFTWEGLSSHLKSICSTPPTEEQIKRTLDLALSLLLMTKFGPTIGEAEPHHYSKWTSGCLRICLYNRFTSDPTLGVNGIRLPREFNAWSLKVIGGIDIGFTDNLDDHLLLVELAKGMKILVFHQVSFLECHTSSIYPDGLVKETIETLKLMFPQSEFGNFGGHKPQHRSWLKRLRDNTPGRVIDGRLGSSGNLRAECRRIERFKFWRDRLVVLKQAYDEATPRTLSQWWYDRRNRVIWWTFWIAMIVLGLGVVVGIVQCVLAGIQTIN